MRKAPIKKTKRETEQKQEKTVFICLVDALKALISETEEKTLGFFLFLFCFLPVFPIGALRMKAILKIYSLRQVYSVQPYRSKFCFIKTQSFLEPASSPRK